MVYFFLLHHRLRRHYWRLDYYYRGKTLRPAKFPVERREQNGAPNADRVSISRRFRLSTKTSECLKGKGVSTPLPAAPFVIAINAFTVPGSFSLR